MNRSYVKDFVISSFVRNKLDVNDYDVDDIIDSILFDWNELGNEGDFEALVDWNVDQFLSHNSPSDNDSGSLKRIRVDEAKNYIPYPKDWIDQPTKPDSKYFYMRTLKNGWDEVRYFLDKKSNLKLYSKKLIDQLEYRN